MNKTRIIKNKALNEYKEKYPNYNDLEKHTVEEVKNNQELLNNKTWWLIVNTYYEAPETKNKNAVIAWWNNLGKGARTAICILGGVAVATAITVPTVIAAKSCSTEKKTISVNSTEVTFSSSFEADGSLKANIKASLATKEIEKLEIKIGDYILKDNEYTFNKESGDLVISANIIKAHKGNIVITPTLKDKGIKVTSIEITNVNKSVGVNNELVLTVKVLPENATNKDVTFTVVDGGTGTGEINGNKLKGKTAGTVKIQASALDGSSVRSTIVDFDIVNLANIKWNGSEKISDTSHGFNGTKNLYETATSATNIIFKKDDSTDGAIVGEDVTKDLIYAKYNSDTLTIWSDNRIAFNANDMIEEEGAKYGPFAICASATKIDLANIDTYALTSMMGMFAACSELKTIDNLSNINTSNVTDMSYLFYGCKKLTSLDLLEFDTSNVTTMEDMFMGCAALTSLDLSSFDTGKVTNMNLMFSWDSDSEAKMALEIIIFGNKFNTSNVETMESMFERCSKLTSLNLTKFNTNKVKKMKHMFYECAELVTLDLSSFNTSNVETMESMFRSCTKLTNLNVSSFTTNKVSEVKFMFMDCEKLDNLNLSSFNLNNVKSLDSMFFNCKDLKTLILPSNDINEVTDMFEMFRGCESLIELDLSSFTFNKIERMSAIFKDCLNLETIYVKAGTDLSEKSSLSETAVDMFLNCSKLVGSSGTTYDSSKVDKSYARVDEGSSKPGYFSTKS